MSLRCVLISVCAFIQIIHSNKETLALVTGVVTKNVTLCGNLTCLHNSMCSDDNKRCQCLMGYKGVQCEQDLNECEFGDPCYHRGYCYNTFGSYGCNCESGWRNGPNNHCESQVISDGHLRKCVPGWMGDRCQQQCLNSSMCGQNQECKKHGRGNVCLCKTKFIKVCKNNANENDCKSNKNGSFICTCPSGWTGPTCSDDVDECLQNQCKNSAVCINSIGSYSCLCMEGWTGKDCYVDVDECLYQPCTASLICHNKPGSFSCDAPIPTKRVDFGEIDIEEILVISLGALLFLLLLICIVITLKKRCKKKSEKHMKVAAEDPDKRKLPQRDLKAFEFKKEQPDAQRQVLDF